MGNLHMDRVANHCLVRLISVALLQRLALFARKRGDSLSCQIPQDQTPKPELRLSGKQQDLGSISIR